MELFEPDELKLAMDYARTYDGSFPFMVAMRERMMNGQSFSPKQVGAILNCLEADAQRFSGPAVTVSTSFDLRQYFPNGQTRVACTLTHDKPGSTRFYLIDNVVKGKWAGWTFVRSIHGENHSRENVAKQPPGGVLTVSNKHRTTVTKDMVWVADQPLFAMAEYGRKIGKCSMCGRRLTDDLSRQRGVGPDCWTRRKEDLS